MDEDSSQSAEDIALLKQAELLQNEYKSLFENLKSKSGKTTNKAIGNLINEGQGVFTECAKSIENQRVEYKRAYKYIIKQYKRVNSRLNNKIQELEENIESPPLKPMDNPFRWWILVLPFFLASCIWLLGYVNILGSIVIEREAASLNLIGIIVNIIFISILIHQFYTNRLKNIPLTDAGRGTFIFQTFWKFSLFSWAAMYLILGLYNFYLVEYAPHVKEYSGLIWPIKVNPKEWAVLFPLLANLLSAMNSAFMYICFLVLATNIPLRKKNLRIRIRFRYFIIILSVLLFLALIDELINNNVLFNGLSMTLFLSFMAATFILFAAKLESPLFNKQPRIFTMGIIYFYGATMAVFGIVQTGTISAVSTFALIIFGIGKFVFGSNINDKIKSTNVEGSSSEIISYLEKYYKN